MSKHPVPGVKAHVKVHMLAQAHQHGKEAGIHPAEQAFPEKVRSAFLQVVNDRKYTGQISRFLSAYEFKAQFEWLGESGSRAGIITTDGLAYALRTALVNYTIPPTLQTARTHYGLRRAYGRRRQSDKSARATALKKAIDVAVTDQLSMDRFKNRLTRSGSDVENASLAEIQKHILMALDKYCAEQETGISYDEA
jgi:hypothetical protein